MNKPKRAQVEKTSKKLKSERSFGAKAQPKGDISSKASARSQLVAQVWQQEVEQLTAQRFKNIEAAIATIASKVSKRFQTEGRQEDAEMESFLRLMLETDPGLQEELRKVLRIDS